MSIEFDDSMKTEKTFVTIDEEIAKHQALILNLKTQRNRLAPISTLPAEVLCHIFYLASRDTSTPTLGWIRLTYVCHDWRELAINSPSLWTRLPMEHDRWVDEMLSRSRMASLTVEHVNQTVRHGRNLLYEVVAHHMPRIELLLVEDLWGVNVPQLLKAIPRSALRLKTLAINSPSSGLSDFIVPVREINTAHRITETSLLEMPRIKRIEIIGIQIDWSLHLPNTLTVLKLHYSPHLTKPTAAQFWNALGIMPLLEKLHLFDCLPPDVKPSTLSTSTQKINFEYLADLKIGAEVEETEYLLEGLGFPTTTVVSVTCRQSRSSDFTGIVSSVVWRSRTIGAQRPTLYLETSESTALIGSGLRICLSSSLPTSKNQHVEQNETSLDFVWAPSSCDTGTVLNNVFQALRPLALNSVNELRITDFVDQMSPAQILETYGSLPHLRKLTGKLGPNFILALQHNLPTAKALGQIKASFPNLQTIVLEGSVFGVQHTLVEGSLPIEMLLDCLMWRYEHGAEVQRLELKECMKLFEDDVASIREIVVEVEWDEKEMMGWHVDNYSSEGDYEDFGYDRDYYGHELYDSDHDDMVHHDWY